MTKICHRLLIHRWTRHAFSELTAELHMLPPVVRKHLIDSLGTGTRRHQLKQTGTRPLLLAAAIFGGLVSGGWAIARLLV